MPGPGNSQGVESSFLVDLLDHRNKLYSMQKKVVLPKSCFCIQSRNRSTRWFAEIFGRTCAFAFSVLCEARGRGLHMNRNPLIRPCKGRNTWDKYFM